MNSDRPGRLIYAMVVVLVTIEFLQLGMTAFAAAPIMGEISISPEDFSLIASAYASVAILAISMQRWFVERIGGRRFIQYSALISATGCVLCATSQNFNTFLLGRIVMATGGGALFTSARMIVHHRLAGPRRFVGIKFLATAVASGVAAAPWLAALAVSHETWGAMYWLLALLGLVAFVIASMTLAEGPIAPPAQRTGAQLWQQILLVAGSFGVLYGLQRLYYDFYGNFAHIAGIMLVSIGALMIYAHRQRRGPRPLLHVRQMGQPRYLGGLALFMFAYVMLGANNYVVPVTLQRTLGFSWETVGHFEALGFIATVVTWGVMTQVIPRAPSPRKFWIVGFVALAGFGALLARINTAANLWTDILPALALYGVFLLTVMPITAMNSFRELEYDETVFSHAQQLKNMLAQGGIALGITLATVGQAWRTAVHYAVLNAQINPGNPIYTATLQQLREALASSVGPAQAGPIATAQIAQMLSQQAAMLANIDHFTLIAVLGVLGVLVTLTQRVFR